MAAYYVISVIFILVGHANSDQVTKLDHLDHHERQLLDNEKYFTEVECHKVSVARCGRTFIRVFKFFDYLNKQEAFQGKCLLRNAFFKCLNKSRDESCSNHKRLVQNERFKVRLMDTLWSTRSCVLGFPV